MWLSKPNLKTKELKLDIDRIGTVSAILMQPDNARACYVLAHGAGAGMRHAFMDEVAEGLADRGIATLRFNFPYMENKRPDPADARARHHPRGGRGGGAGCARA